MQTLEHEEFEQIFGPENVKGLNES